LTQCATKPQVIPDERDVLREKIREFWRYQIDGDVERAYQLEIPEFRIRFLSFNTPIDSN